jgi:hypothetical protein
MVEIIGRSLQGKFERFEKVFSSVLRRLFPKSFPYLAELLTKSTTQLKYNRDSKAINLISFPAFLAISIFLWNYPKSHGQNQC